MELGLQAVREIRLDELGTKMQPWIQQVHQDWVKQQDSARRHKVPVTVCAKDFRHAIVNMKENLPAYLNTRDADGSKKYYKYILRAVRKSRTHCTTLT